VIGQDAAVIASCLVELDFRLALTDGAEEPNAAQGEVTLDSTGLWPACDFVRISF
jgi:hypothetical protein